MKYLILNIMVYLTMDQSYSYIDSSLSKKDQLLNDVTYFISSKNEKKLYKYLDYVDEKTELEIDDISFVFSLIINSRLPKQEYYQKLSNILDKHKFDLNQYGSCGCRSIIYELLIYGYFDMFTYQLLIANGADLNIIQYIVCDGEQPYTLLDQLNRIIKDKMKGKDKKMVQNLGMIHQLFIDNGAKPYHKL